MDFLTLTLELFRNADHFIMYIAQTYGWWVYLVLFMIFYSETGIVICAFLPGDSLLFIAGAAAAAGALIPGSSSSSFRSVRSSETQRTSISAIGSAIRFTTAPLAGLTKML